MNIIAIIQARITSQRLPGKVLMPLPFNTGKPLLKWITDSLNQSKIINKVVVASSTNEENDAIESFCKKNDLAFFRGHEEDVLSRFIEITGEEVADAVVRLTGDNPFLDIELLDEVIDFHINENVHYTSTKGLPLGMNFEIISGKALLSIPNGLTKKEKEHVTSFIRSNKAFDKRVFNFKKFERLESLRLTVDYPEDYLVLSFILSCLKSGKNPSVELLQEVLKEYPWVFEVNKSKVQKQIFNSFEGEKKEAISILRKFDFNRTADYLSK